MEKAPDAFRTISEVADELDIPQHVLRFWESRFPQIKPMKRAGGRRYYRPDDVDLLKGIKYLLYTQCLRIEGVQNVLRDKEKGPKFVQAVWQSSAAQPAAEAAEDAAYEDAETDAQDGSEQEEAPRTLLGLFKGAASGRRDAEAEAAEESESNAKSATAPAAPQLSRENVRKLQSALHELRECRQAIDQALKDEAA
ncbi:MerR family transcriptional regulator [Rhodoplanes sp. Z2-YC6860]|uniref:MerR family transcriptional regulator n=1 Tax=Rhodoplanes sp. Z2-YC6860 TaxID=674703 RepID=UPI00078E9083|nr:MerR family transcriptional regulator [Rhodoplanes sp. Z2-YC6860]AMN42198.1 MerR family transcriptional regulator [Rhodoplanes sp. Z2-YC6860]